MAHTSSRGLMSIPESTRNVCSRPDFQPVRFVLLKHYCKLTGDSPQAVHNRRHRGDWIDGKHCILVDGRRLWINMMEVEHWILNGGRTN